MHQMLADRLDERREQDYIGEEEEGYFEFDQRRSSEFHFGYVHGQMSCLPAIRDDEPAVE